MARKLDAAAIEHKRANRRDNNPRVAYCCRVSAYEEEQAGSFESQVQNTPEWDDGGLFSDEYFPYGQNPNVRKQPIYSVIHGHFSFAIRLLCNG